ncbi:MAG: hypothetical protein QOI10_3430 [Solirubrobacterales bacterium]|nr:hypothetical protein [Solirubrobacterales bacterium]
MILALMVLTITTLMIAAAFVAANGDVKNSQHDIDAKNAYYAARAGLSNFLYKLNKNTELWQTCPTQAATQVPGAPSTVKFSYTTVPANGNASCSTTNPVGTMIDFPTGSFRMKFTGTVSNAAGATVASRTIVAGFRRDSPLDYLWYSVYETLDPNTYSDPSQYQDCKAFKRDGRPSKCGSISWITGDNVKGPMYTQDQYSICGSPTFGRAGGTDTISSAAPGPPTAPGLIATSGCTNSAILNGPVIENAPFITPPPDNTNLLAYAQTDGKVYSGKTTIVLNGNTATVTNANTTACGTNCQTNCAAGCSVNLVNDPIIYVTSGTCSSTYTPYFAGTTTYTNASTCGNIYVSGTYSSSVTIAAANDIIVNGSVTTNLSGSAVMGMVANNFIRVMHAVATRSDTSTTHACTSTDDNVSAYTLPTLRIDSAVLALNHSFIVDNYDCGDPITGNLTVNGAIAQLFRGTVGTTSGGSSVTGYLKNYTYDDRLAVQQPPYLFDIASAAWREVRETGCVPGSSDVAVAC